MRFSVIIPLYNKVQYVERAILSVLAQTYTDYELIIVDDGSTDGSANVVAQMEGNNQQLSLLQKCGRFLFVKQQNKGAGAARNNGTKISKGEYLCFLDADDWWSENFLLEMDTLINKYPKAGVYGTAYFRYIHSKTEEFNFGLDCDFRDGYINYFRSYLRGNRMAMPLWTGAVAIPRKEYFEVGGFSEKLTLGEDFYLWIHLALKYKVAFLNNPLSYYFQDLPASQRAIGRLHNPKTHMLWGLDDLEPVEKTNEDYKRLIDKLRVTGLYQYYLDKRYKNAAIQELKKVDWCKQPLSVRLRYRMPVVLLRMWQGFMNFGSTVKQRLIKKMLKA